MSVNLEFINILIPIENINKSKIIGGFDGLLEMDKDYLGALKWYDDYLYREGAMNMYDISSMLKTWEERGLKLFEESEGGRVWKDLCVVDSATGLTLPCNWIEVDLDNHCAKFIPISKA